MYKFTFEHWEADEYIILCDGIGIVSATYHENEARIIANYLNTQHFTDLINQINTKRANQCILK